MPAVIDLPKRLGLLLHMQRCSVPITELVYSSKPVLSTYILELTAISKLLFPLFTYSPIFFTLPLL
jgi:hypothetical protein